MCRLVEAVRFVIHPGPVSLVPAPLLPLLSPDGEKRNSLPQIPTL